MKKLSIVRRFIIGAFIASTSAVMAQEGASGKHFHQKKTSILMPMIQTERVNVNNHEEVKDHKILAKMLMEVHDGGREMEIELAPHPEGWNERREAIEGRVLDALRESYGGFGNTKVLVKTSKKYSEANEGGFSGPLAVALGASLENKSMLPGLTVCFDLQAAKQLQRPPRFWSQLEGLRNSSKPHRVLVAAKTEEDFKQLIAMKDFDFFILNELVVVGSLADAVKASYTGGDADLLAASKEFALVQKVSMDKGIKTLINHPQMRAKLSKVFRLFPNHLSAKMLLLAGEEKGFRPDYLSDKYAAFEMSGMVNRVEQHLEAVAYEEDQNLRMKKEGELKALAVDLENEMDAVRKFLNGAMKSHCYTLKNDIPLALNSWARSLRQPDAKYHRKNSETQKNRIQKHIREIQESFRLAQKDPAQKDPAQKGGPDSPEPEKDDKETFNDENN